MAPEVIQQAGYDFKADIWSLGITAMELANGEPPNASNHPMKVLFLIPKAPAPRLEGSIYSRDFKEFVAACLVKDPDRRPTARELLQYRFIKNAGVVEGLRDLIKHRQSWDGSKENGIHPKFYEETLSPMSMPESREDWLFDTVKGPTNAIPKQPIHLTQRRQREPVARKTMAKEPEKVLDHLTLEETQQIPSTSTMQRTTMKRRPSLIRTGSSAKRRSSGHRQPLAPSTNFGNNGSSVRQFRRVSEQSQERSPNFACDGDENRQCVADAVTKEALLGRRAYTKVIDQAFQETCAQTSNQSKRGLIARVALAWDRLDREDPEGEFHFLKLVTEKLQRFDKFLFFTSNISRVIRFL